MFAQRTTAHLLLYKLPTFNETPLSKYFMCFFDSFVLSTERNDVHIHNTILGTTKSSPTLKSLIHLHTLQPPGNFIYSTKLKPRKPRPLSYPDPYQHRTTNLRIRHTAPNILSRKLRATTSEKARRLTDQSKIST